jgi:hypothetical protein
VKIIRNLYAGVPILMSLTACGGGDGRTELNYLYEEVQFVPQGLVTVQAQQRTHYTGYTAHATNKGNLDVYYFASSGEDSVGFDINPYTGDLFFQEPVILAFYPTTENNHRFSLKLLAGDENRSYATQSVNIEIEPGFNVPATGDKDNIFPLAPGNQWFYVEESSSWEFGRTVYKTTFSRIELPEIEPNTAPDHVRLNITHYQDTVSNKQIMLKTDDYGISFHNDPESPLQNPHYPYYALLYGQEAGETIFTRRTPTHRTELQGLTVSIKRDEDNTFITPIGEFPIQDYSRTELYHPDYYASRKLTTQTYKMAPGLGPVYRTLPNNGTSTLIGHRLQGNDYGVLSIDILDEDFLPHPSYEMGVSGPAIASDGENALALYIRKNGYLYARMIHADGTFGASTSISSGARSPQVAYSNGEYHIVFTKNHQLQLARISANGELITPHNNAQSIRRDLPNHSFDERPWITGDGTNLLITWNSTHRAAQHYEDPHRLLNAALISPTGEILNDTTLQDVQGHNQSTRSTSIFHNEQYVVAWSKYSLGSGYSHSVARINNEGELLDTAAIPPQNLDPLETPRLALGKQGILKLLWLDSHGSVYQRPITYDSDNLFFYIAVKNLTDNNTSLKQFTDQEINLLKRPPAAAFP